MIRKLIPFSIRLKIEVEVNKSNSKGSRVVEIPFVVNNIEIRRPCNVLSFGSFNDIVAIELASLGLVVTAFDLTQNVFVHPNFKSVVGDFLETSKVFEDGSFDVAYALSSLEHVGLEVYGQNFNEVGDKQVVKIIERLLKPHGRFLLTVPFGKKGLYPRAKPTYRKYATSKEPSSNTLEVSRKSPTTDLKFGCTNTF